ncbi:hypothetical protein EDC04DRAFT_2600612 [Pisolithus marmoratus]|nr:hypothetical protein EDC04DRAFT_2600612 [Pisolithus marmoratus]
MYHYIEDHAPYAIELMKDKKRHNQFNALISKVRFNKGFLHGFELIQARYSLTSHEKWKQHDSVFDYTDFYYRILNFLTCKADKKWCQSLYSYLNKRECGQRDRLPQAAIPGSPLTDVGNNDKEDTHTATELPQTNRKKPKATQRACMPPSEVPAKKNNRSGVNDRAKVYQQYTIWTPTPYHAISSRFGDEFLRNICESAVHAPYSH